LGRRRGVAAKIGLGRETVKRGLMAVNALRRIVTAGRLPDMREQLDKEKDLFSKHRRQARHRTEIYALMDQMARVYGRLLGFYLDPNENNCAICKEMEGKNFYYYRQPRDGYPGAVHPNCKCSAGAPFPNAPMLP
jgi:hypothetical protein